MDCRLPGSSVQRIFQATVLEWIAISFSRGSSWPRDWTQVSYIVDTRFTVWATREVIHSFNSACVDIYVLSKYEYARTCVSRKWWVLNNMCQMNLWTNTYLIEVLNTFWWLSDIFMQIHTHNLVLTIYWAAILLYSLVGETVKRLPAMRETRVRFLGWEDPLEKEMAIHSSTLAWKIPWMEEPDRLQYMGSQRVGHNWATPLSCKAF